MADKQIKIQMILDEASKKQVIQGLEQINLKLKEIVESSAKVSQNFQNIMGGSMGGVGVGRGKTGSGGGGGTRASTSVRVGVDAGGLASVLKESTKSFNELKQMGPSAMNAVTAVLKRDLREQMTAIDASIQKIGQYKQALDKLDSDRRAGKISDKPYEAVAANLLNSLNQEQSKRGSAGSKKRDLESMLDLAEGVGGGARPGFLSRAGQWLRTPMFGANAGVAPTGSFWGSAAGSAAGSGLLGSLGRVATTPLGIAGAAIGLGVGAYNLYSGYQRKEGQMSLAGLQAKEQAISAPRIAFQQLGMQALHGDPGVSVAMDYLSGSPEGQQRIASLMAQREYKKQVAAGVQDASQTVIEAGIMKNISSNPELMTSRAVSELMADTEYRTQTVEMVNKVQQEKAMDIYLRQNAPGAALQYIQAGRAMGGMRPFGEQVGGVYKPGAYDSLRRMKIQYGLDEGAITGSSQQMQGIAGRAAAGFGTSALMAQMGGLNAAHQIIGAGHMFSNVGGRGFFRAVQNMVGPRSGGIDAGAASILGAAASQQMMAGTGGTSGLGLLGAMGAFSGMGGGYKPGEQMAIAHQIQAGLGQMGGLFGGQQSPFQTGVNTLNAIGSGARGIYAQDYLATKMSPMALAEAMGKRGEVSPIMKSMGLTSDMVRDFGKRTMQSAIYQYVDQGNDSGMDKMARRIRGGENIRDIVQGTKGKKAREGALSDYAALMLNLGFAQDEQGAMGMARLQAGLGSTASDKGAKGRGAGIGKLPKELQEAMTAQQAVMDKIVDMWKTNAGQVADQMKRAAEKAGPLSEGMLTVTGSVEQFGKALDDVTMAIQFSMGQMDPTGAVMRSNIAQWTADGAATEKAASWAARTGKKDLEEKIRRGGRGRAANARPRDAHGNPLLR